jgi:cobalt-zinc-cadmium efflux system membrane fusion protein
LAGIRTAQPARDDMTDGINCLAEIVYDQNRFARIAAPVGGIVKEVIADLGDRVEENEPVARLWSAEIAETVARAVLSHQTLERERKLRAEGITPAKDLQEAEAAHRAACQQARTLGFTEAEIDRLGAKPDEPVYLEIRAPFAGEIIDRKAVRGELIEAGRPLFTVADRGTMWAMLSVPEAAIAHLATGQAVELTVDALPGQTFKGQLTWIAAEVDETTRLARARAEIPNPDGQLRARMFARARVLTRRAANALVLPPQALQQVDDTALVFVKLGEDLYEARGVRVGARHNGHVEILEGLEPTDQVVVDQGFTVKSQLLISRLGVGCTH